MGAFEIRDEAIDAKSIEEEIRKRLKLRSGKDSLPMEPEDMDSNGLEIELTRFKENLDIVELNSREIAQIRVHRRGPLGFVERLYKALIKKPLNWIVFQQARYYGSIINLLRSLQDVSRVFADLLVKYEVRLQELDGNVKDNIRGLSELGDRLSALEEAGSSTVGNPDKSTRSELLSRVERLEKMLEERNVGDKDHAEGG
jgi:hypothetical protein